VGGFSDKKADDAAKGLLKELFPTREIIQVPCLDLLAGGGGIHCMTMQQPEVL
jgi:agmatine deiminase